MQKLTEQSITGPGVGCLLFINKVLKVSQIKLSPSQLRFSLSPHGFSSYSVLIHRVRPSIDGTVFGSDRNKVTQTTHPATRKFGDLRQFKYYMITRCGTYRPGEELPNIIQQRINAFHDRWHPRHIDHPAILKKVIVLCLPDSCLHASGT